MVLSLSVPSAQQRTLDLDFMSMEQPHDDSGSDSGTHTVSGGAVVASPLRVQLLTIEPGHSCTVGDLITFDVALRNVSRADLFLPWSMDSRDQGDQAPGFFPVLSLSLTFEDDKRRGLLDVINLLYGNTFNAFTTKRLPAGQEVVIRGRGTCGEIGGPDKGFDAGFQRLRVSARATLWYRTGASESVLGPSSTSSNSIPLTMSWPATPQ
jgi:hypothetical protein